MRVTFKLKHTDSDVVIKESNFLLDIYDHIRLQLNEPRSYHVEEFTGKDLEDVCSAYYLLENYTRLTLPLTIQYIT